jgi:hypothetical protein
VKLKPIATILLGLLLGVPVSAQQSTQPATDDTGRTSKVLRNACVALERVEVATDANDFSHLKDTDWMEARYCQGFIQGFEKGANHTVNVLEEPKRLEIFESQHTERQIAKTVVAFIDEHPDEEDTKNILLGALKKADAVQLFGNIKMQDLTPDCPKDPKVIPAGECWMITGLNRSVRVVPEFHEGKPAGIHVYGIDPSWADQKNDTPHSP